jgi:DNA-binding beta-propeller fold protein YncE
MLGYIILVRKFTYVLLTVALLWGCGGMKKFEKPDFSSYAWPPKPYPPKVKLIDVIRSDLDMREKTTREVLFGEQAYFAFKKPHGIAVDIKGNILVSDTYKGTVFVLDMEKGNVGQLRSSYSWKSLAGLATDNVNGLIGATSGNVVRIFDQNSKKVIMTLGGAEKLKRPASIAFDPERKRIYISDSKKHEVHAYDYDGNHLTLVADDTDVYYPGGVAVNPANGRIYIVDSMHFRVVVFNPDYSYAFAFGEHGDMPGMFARPKHIAINHEGMVFITDAAFGNFQIFHPDGRIFGFVGAPGGRFGAFNQPQGIAIDEDDKIYVVDQTNRRIQIFQYLSDKYLQSHPDEAAEVEKAWDILREKQKGKK